MGCDAPQSGHVIYLWMHKAKRINCIMHKGQNFTCSGELLLSVSTFAIRREISGAGEREKLLLLKSACTKFVTLLLFFSAGLEKTPLTLKPLSSLYHQHHHHQIGFRQSIHPPTHLADLKCISKISSQTKVKLCTCMDG